MQIAKLQIDRFGAWKDLALGPLSSGLNVVYGQEPADRAAIIDFLRAMLFGFGDGVRQHHLAPGWADAGGSLTMTGGLGLQTVYRHQGDRQGRLILENEDGSILARERLDDLLGGTSSGVFDSLFVADFHQPYQVDQLVDAAVAHGLPIIGGHGDPARLEPLRNRLGEQRRLLESLAADDLPLSALLERRRNLRVDVEALEAAAQHHSEQGGHKRRKLQAELVELEQQLDQMQGELRSLDADLPLRQDERQRRAEAVEQDRIDQQQRVVERRQRLTEIDGQLERWRQVLRDVEIRRERLQTQSESEEFSAERAVDPRHSLRLLEERVERLHAEVLEMHPDDARVCQCRQLRPRLAPALQAMREEIYRLCNQFSQWEASARRSESSSELGQMRRCESELRQAIKGLALRRQELLGELATFQRSGILSPATHPGRCRCVEHPDLELLSDNSDPPGLDEELLSVLDAEIDRLVQRRGELLADIEELEDELHEVRRQLEALQATGEPNPHQQRLESKRRELQRVERQICDGEKRRELQASVAQLEGEIQILEPATRPSEVLRQAAELLRGLSLEELQQISVAPERTVHVQTRKGDRLPLAELRPDQHDQVYLSLCLALAAALARDGKQLPLILHDVLLRQDAPHSQAAASLLRDFSRRGQQVLLLLGSEQIAEMFRTREIPIRRLPSPRPVELPQAAEPAAPFGERERLEINRRLSEIAEETAAVPRLGDRSAFSAEEFPGELTDRVRPQSTAPAEAAEDAEPHDSAYFLSESSLIQEAPSIDGATAERFRRIGVVYVRDLLQIDLTDAADRLRHAGVTAGMISRWRSEALLVCRVAHLRPYDARILVACGIETPEQLGGLDADELCRRVEAFAGTSIGQVLIRAGNRFELSRLTNWIKSARRSDRNRGQDASSPRGQREPGRQREDRPRTRTRRQQAGDVQTRPRRRRQSDTSTMEAVGEAAATVQQPPTDGLGGGEPRGARPPRDASTSAVDFRGDAEPAILRFHLNTNDPIEFAPSVGPRTAERLENIGIRTVADFLRADPAATAGRLDHRYIRPETVRQWQQQTMLICRVPQLRGQDAQILVACGITIPEQLGAADAAELWARVEPFSETMEGKRILRGGRAPQREDVHSWIRWAGQARKLQAA